MEGILATNENQRNCLIDLHLHLDGSLSPACVKHLAQMQDIALPGDDAALLRLLRVDEGCRDLNDNLTKFNFPLSLLQTEAAISQSVYTLCEELKAQGLIYAEIRFAPQLHLRKGLTQAQVVAAAIAGAKRSDFRSNLILCCMRGDDNHAQNLETIHTAAAFYAQRVCAVDLAGAEALFSTERFADLFALAEKLGLLYTIHAGEADGPQSVETALDFGAKRIGHGVRSAEDEGLMRRLAAEKITLELCPTSNLHTNIFSDISEYPLRKLMDAGVRVTINTDNMTVSGTTLRAEFEQVADAFALTESEVKTLLLNAASAAFAHDATKRFLRERIEAELG